MESCSNVNDRRAAVNVTLFGGFRLFDCNHHVRIPRNCQRLVAFLAFHSPAGRDEVSGTLWPEVDNARALASLRTSIWHVRRYCAGLIVADADHLRFSDGVQLDAIDFEERAHRILHKPQNVTVTELTCGRQELLPGWYDDWVLLERERTRQLQLHVLEAAGEELLSRQKPEAALCAALDAVQVEPLRESAIRLVIRIHISEGNICEAIRHYRRYLHLLRGELGISPTEQLEELVAGLLDPNIAF
jgi:DNA-binding SARP family transcriptional activator